MKWNYEIDKNTALALRNAIESDNGLATVLTIERIYQEMMRLIPEDIISDEELQDYIDEVDSIDTDDEEEVNYQLSNLYDLCDNLGIWIATR